MKFGMNLLLWTDHVSAKEHASLFERIKGYGFDGVEVPLDGLNQQEVKEISAKLSSVGLDVTTICALDATVADPASPDPRLRAAAVDYLQRMVDHTKLLGADLLAGPVFQGLGRFTGQGPEPSEWIAAVNTIRRVGEYAAGHGVRLALEPLNRFEMYMVNTLEDAVRFVEDVGLVNVGLLADTHHSHIEEANTAAAWANAWPHIFHIHLSENHRGVPGTGQAITDDVFDLLTQKSYNDWVTIEAFNGNVPGLASRLHLWRRHSANDDEPARLGIRFVKERLGPQQ